MGEVKIEEGVVSLNLIGGTIGLTAISVQNARFDSTAIANGVLRKAVNERVVLVAGDIIVLRDPAIRMNSDRI